MEDSGKPYVYRLVDPRDGRPFYIGKGRDRRAWISMRTYGSNGASPRKRAVIQALEDAGLEPTIEICSWHATDDEARAAEVAEINRIGLENLTNANARLQRDHRAALLATHQDRRARRAMAGISKERKSVVSVEPMPARKAPSPGIGRPLARLEYKIDALAEATARLADATAALLAHATHPPVMIAPSRPLSAQAAPAQFSGIVTAVPIAVPRGTHGHAIYEGDPIVAPTSGTIGLASGTGLSAIGATEFTDEPQPPDLNATLAAELASFAQEDEEPPPPPTDNDMYDQWSRRVDMFRQQKMWLEGWGPTPAQAGCLAPPELIQGRRR